MLIILTQMYSTDDWICINGVRPMSVISSRLKVNRYSSSCTHLRATGRHLLYGITQGYPTQVKCPAKPQPERSVLERLTYPRGMDGWVDLVVLRWFTRPQTVTHPSVNRARCRATTLIKTSVLLLSQAHYLITVVAYLMKCATVDMAAAASRRRLRQMMWRMRWPSVFAGWPMHTTSSS